MKKWLFTAYIAVFSLAVVNSQEIRYGAKAGINYTILNGDYEIGFDAKFRASFHTGVVVEVMISDKFSVQPELTYSSQGFKYETEELLGGITDITLKGVSKLDYLNLPVMGKFYITEGLSVQFGPQVGFLLSAEREIETPEIPVLDTAIELLGLPTLNEVIEALGITILDDVKRNYKNIDFGINVGIGYTLKQQLFFDARLHLGLFNINNNPLTSSIIEAQNVVMQFSVGYLF